jgi:hypothetical protein
MAEPNGARERPGRKQETLPEPTGAVPPGRRSERRGKAVAEKRPEATKNTLS